MIYAANFHTGAIDVYDTNFAAVTLTGTPFVDGAVPAGYGPFNIWNLGGKHSVDYADSYRWIGLPAALVVLFLALPFFLVLWIRSKFQS